MRRVHHRGLMRGRLAERASVLLFFGLLIVLLAAVAHGVGTLAS